MDSLFSQLKGQGSPFSSPSPTSNVDKLLDTIHLLSQATLLVAQQLQEREQPVKPKPTAEARPPASLPTPKPSPPPTAKKAPLPTPKAPALAWVPQSPEHYSRPTNPHPPLPTTTPTPSPTNPPPPTTTPTPSPAKLQGYCKKLRQPKAKRIQAPSPTPQPPAHPTPTPQPSAHPMPTSKPLSPPTTSTPLPAPLPTPLTTQVAKPAIPTTLPLGGPWKLPPLSDEVLNNILETTRRKFLPKPTSFTTSFTPETTLHQKGPAQPPNPTPTPTPNTTSMPPTGSGVLMDDGTWYPVPTKSPSPPPPPGKPVDPVDLSSFKFFA